MLLFRRRRGAGCWGERVARPALEEDVRLAVGICVGVSDGFGDGAAGGPDVSCEVVVV